MIADRVLGALKLADMSVGQLSQCLDLPEQTIDATVSRMERAGYVVKRLAHTGYRLKDGPRWFVYGLVPCST